MGFFANKDEQQRRREICGGCKHFKKDTRSCGPLIQGRELSPEEARQAGLIVSHHKSRYRLCGCFIPAKVQFNLARCPLGKWKSASLSEEEISDLRAMIADIRSRSRLSTNELAPLYKYAEKMTGQKLKVTSCSSCVKQLIADIEQQLKEA